MNATITTADRVAGAIHGLAYGDAWGYLVEFDRFPKIQRKYGLGGPAFPRRAIVSDDTQMSLAVWQALTDADGQPQAAALTKRFLQWRSDPDNDRAPGATCMASLARIAKGATWIQATDIASKGCGAVMRAPWIGLHPAVADEDISTLAQLQAAITHGHPTAVVAADVTARLVAELAHGDLALSDAVGRGISLANGAVYADALGLLWQRDGASQSGDDYIGEGAWEVATALRKIRPAVRRLLSDPMRIDPCTLTGEGWTAEEALATALLIVSAFGDDPVAALRHAATTGGDSDSIAAIVGALLGAAHGDVWPTSWRKRLEPRYRIELAAAVEDVLAHEAAA